MARGIMEIQPQRTTAAVLETPGGLGNCVGGTATMTHHNTPQDIPLKRCAKCGEEKPATIEYFYKDKKSPSGFASRCITCKLEYARAYRESRKDALAAWQRDRRERDPETIRRLAREYRARVKEKARLWQRKRRETHREDVRQQNRASYARHKEHYAAYNKMYRRQNRDIVNAAASRHKARKLAAEGNHTGDDIKRQYEQQRGKCYYCGKKVGKNYHVDHVVPLSRGGSNGPDNLVIACPSCNISKRDKLPHEWHQGGRLL